MLLKMPKRENEIEKEKKTQTLFLFFSSFSVSFFLPHKRQAGYIYKAMHYIASRETDWPLPAPTFNFTPDRFWNEPVNVEK